MYLGFYFGRMDYIRILPTIIHKRLIRSGEENESGARMLGKARAN